MRIMSNVMLANIGHAFCMCLRSARVSKGSMTIMKDCLLVLHINNCYTEYTVFLCNKQQKILHNNLLLTQEDEDSFVYKHSFVVTFRCRDYLITRLSSDSDKPSRLIEPPLKFTSLCLFCISILIERRRMNICNKLLKLTSP